MVSISPKPGILDIVPYVGGKSNLSSKRKIIKLSSNEGALGPTPLAIKAFDSCANSLHRYPDGAAENLRNAIGERYNLNPKQIVCGAGSDELLTLLCRSFAGTGDEVLYSEYGFAMYPIMALSVGAKPVKAPEKDLSANVENLLNAVTNRTKIVFLANPNNPTGTYLSSLEMSHLREKLRDDILLVIDAAYAEFVHEADYEPGFELVNQGENTVMTRTFSKIHALGGLRLGWAYCPQHIVDILNRIRSPFNVSRPALEAGIASFSDEEFLRRSQYHNDFWREWTKNELMNLGLSVSPSVCNFLLVCFNEKKSHSASSADSFLESKGILVRNLTNYNLPNCLRISIGLEEEMKILIDSLSLFLSQDTPVFGED